MAYLLVVEDAPDLALVKKLAAAMGGLACVDSTPGEGSHLSVSLPAAGDSRK